MFDPQLTAAEWYLGGLSSEDLPAFAVDALKHRHDGNNLRRLAGLVRPTRRDVERIVDGAFRELGVAAPLSKDNAALRALVAVKAGADAADLTAQNLVGKLLTALPELEEPYLARLKAYCGRPGNYEAIFDFLRPALREHIAERSLTGFLPRASSFIEEVCSSGDAEAINVLWIEIFEWLVHSPAGELRTLWPILGPSTRATIRKVALRRSETENLP